MSDPHEQPIRVFRPELQPSPDVQKKTVPPAPMHPVFAPDLRAVPIEMTPGSRAAEAPSPMVFAPQLRSGGFVEDDGGTLLITPVPDAHEPGAPGTGTLTAVAAGIVMVLVALTLDWVVSLAPGRPMIAALAGAGLALIVVALGAAAWREWRALRALEDAAAARVAVASARSSPAKMRRALDAAADRLVETRLAVGEARKAWRATAPVTDTVAGLEAEFARIFLSSIDNLALTAVASAAKTAAASVSLSPSPAGDFALFAWGCLRLLRQVAKMYGLKPGRAAELRLLRRVLADASMMAAADVLSDTVSQTLGKLAGMVTGRAAEAALASQRMARFGLVVMGACRPLAFDDRDAPGLRSVLEAALVVRPAG